MPGYIPPARLKQLQAAARNRNRPSPPVHGGTPKFLQIPGVSDTPAVRGLNVRGLQTFLRNKGFDVTVDGHLGPQTKSALRDAIDKGIMKNPTQADLTTIRGMHGQVLGPKAFDTMIHDAGKPPFLQHPIDAHGNTAGNQMGGLNANAATSGGNGGQAINTGPVSKALKFSTGKAIPTADAQFGTPFDVNGVAQAMAQQQFQPQINEQQLLVNRDPTQAAQNLKDVTDWYNQVTGAQQAAGQADTTATNQGVDATNAATKALIASLGGSANQGSGDVATAGQNAANTLQAIGNSQAGLDNELAPILAAQAAQQKQNQANLDTAKQQADQQVLQNLQGQEGNAETSAQMQLQAANNSLDQARQGALQNILEYNNSLGQQKYQNQLGMMSAQIAAAMNGVSMAKNQAEANYYNAHGQYYLHGGAGGGGRSASQLNDISTSILGNLISRGLITGGNGQPYKMAGGVTPKQVLQAARTAGSGYGSLPNSFIPNTVLSGIQGY